MTTAHALQSAAPSAVALAFAVTLAISSDAPTTPGTAASPIPKSNVVTLANLQEAFAAEKNCEARYLVYAQQADREGYKRVASLFRAAARAEAVHAANHVHALAWLRAEARVQLEKTYADTTLANLAASIVDEAMLAQEIYPAYLGQARADRQTAAVRAFNYALGAEDDHVRLMLDVLGSLPGATAATPYFVCPKCGRTVAVLDSRRCPVCFTPARRFERVI